MSMTDSEILAIIKEQLETGNKAELTVSGNSMYPLFVNGKTTVVLTKAKLPPKKHDIVLYTRPSGQVVLHRVTKVMKETACLCGDAQRVIEQNVPFTAICATATESRTNGKTRKLNTAGNSFYGSIVTVKRLLSRAKAFLQKRLKREKK